MRAQWTITLFRLTALTTRSAPTISITKLCRAGLSIAFTLPREEYEREDHPRLLGTAGGDGPRGRARGPPSPAWVTISSLRF